MSTMGERARDRWHRHLSRSGSMEPDALLVDFATTEADAAVKAERERVLDVMIAECAEVQAHHEKEWEKLKDDDPTKLSRSCSISTAVWFSERLKAIRETPGEG